MPARTYHYNASAAESTTTSTSYQDKCSLTFTPAASSTYLYLLTAIGGTNSAIYGIDGKLLNTTSAVTFANPIYVSKDTTDYISFFGMGVETFGASPASQTLKYQYAVQNASATAKTRDATLLALKLESGEAASTGGSPTGKVGTTYSTVDSVTLTLDNGVDYYVIAAATCTMNSTAFRAQIKLTDGTTNWGLTDHDAAATASSMPWGTIAKVTGAGASKTFSIQATSSSVSGTNTVSNYYVAVLKASRFDTAQYAESRARATTTSATYQDKASLTFTPTAKEHLILGCGVVDCGSTINSALLQLVEGATGKGEHIHEASTTGAGGGQMAYLQAYVSTLAASSTTWKTQYKSETAGTTTGLGESAILALQLESGSTAYSLTSDAGSYTLTGQSAGLRATRVMPAAAGSYALTGVAAGLKVGRRLAADAGAYTLTGVDAALKRTRALVASPGSYGLTGSAAALRATRTLSLAAGSYALTGQNAGLSRTRALLAAAGSYSLTGIDAALRRTARLAAAAGSYAVTGSDAGLSRTRSVAAATGVYALTGQDAALRSARRLAALTGTYLLAGNDATLRYSAEGATALTAEAGSYTLTGINAALRTARRLTAGAGAYVLTGNAAGLSRLARITAGAGLYALTGSDADLVYSSAPEVGGGGEWIVRARRRGRR